MITKQKTFLLIATVFIMCGGVAQKRKFETNANVIVEPSIGTPIGKLKATQSVFVGGNFIYEKPISAAVLLSLQLGGGALLGKKDKSNPTYTEAFYDDIPYKYIRFGVKYYIAQSNFFAGLKVGGTRLFVLGEKENGFTYQPQLGYSIGEFKGFDITLGFDNQQAKSYKVQVLTLGLGYHFIN